MFSSFPVLKTPARLSFLQKVILIFLFIDPLIRLFLFIRQTFYLSSLSFPATFLQHKIFKDEAEWVLRTRLHMLIMGLDFLCTSLLTCLYAAVVYYGLMTWILEVPARKMFPRYIPPIDECPTLLGELFCALNFFILEDAFHFVVFLPCTILKLYMLDLPDDKENGSGVPVMKIIMYLIPSIGGLTKAGFITIYHLVPKIWPFANLLSNLVISSALYLAFYFLHRSCPNPTDEFGEKVTALAQKVGFDPQNIFVDQGTSSIPNAYQFTGFFGLYHHIVFSKGLLNILNIEQSISVLGHELGNWAMSHWLNPTIIEFSYEFVLIMAFALFARPSLYKALGWDNSKNKTPWLVMFLSISFLLSAMDTFTKYLITVLVHLGEYQADAYGAGLNSKESMIDMMWKLMEMGREQSDGLVSWLTRTHPTSEERIRALGGVI